MIPNPIPPPDLTSFFNRFSNEKIHQFGLALIQQSQHSIQMQQQGHHPASSQHSPRRLPRIIRPSLETIYSIPLLMNHQPNCSEVRPLMKQQTTPVTSTPRRPASDSFDTSDGNRQRMKKCLRINDLSPLNEQIEQHHLPTLVPPHHHQHSFNMNVLKRAVSNINQDTARQQILKTTPAAVGFSSIHYHHRQRPSYDIRFTVRSLEQYQTALELGRLSIGHYLSTNILYSMLENWSHERQMSITSQLSEELELAVDKALTADAIKRSVPGEISRSFQQHANDFPLLNQAKEMSDLVVTIKALSETMIRMEKSFNDLKNRIEVQLIGTILHSNSICAIIDMVQIMSSWVQGWGTRALKALDLIFKVDSPVCVFTEVGKLSNSFKVPHFTSFYQKGTNHSGGVLITIGKHLRATRIDTDIENTVIVDIHCLSAQMIIKGIYWPQGQMRNLKDISPFLVKSTILTGDFNAISDE
ncbi:unnamed protein product [Rotaria magnacalcarata]|uniref:Endonuclease/exonuclease/phosphatase domain-containing protein n=1 Tax=Rotaria magnacalcarata TaxID=392030 RepID=A0A820FHZ5_9BILA|nr:unnamed protein product [Rotaria magnacalcarata]CAF4265040.1 unnamed protein product [Rotaria magnacalcarata]